MRVGGYSCGLVGVSLPIFFPSLCFSRWLLLVYSLYTFQQLVGSFVLILIYPIFYPSKKKKREINRRIDDNLAIREKVSE